MRTTVTNVVKAATTALGRASEEAEKAIRVAMMALIHNAMTLMVRRLSAAPNLIPQMENP